MANQISYFNLKKVISSHIFSISLYLQISPVMIGAFSQLYFEEMLVQHFLDMSPFTVHQLPIGEFYFIFSLLKHDFCLLLRQTHYSQQRITIWLSFAHRWIFVIIVMIIFYCLCLCKFFSRIIQSLVVHNYLKRFQLFYVLLGFKYIFPLILSLN